MRLFCGSSNRQLGEKIAVALDIELGKATIDKFPDGEFNIHILEDVRHTDVFILQSTCKPVNDNLMELLLLIRSFRRASARSLTALVPYLGYARADRKMAPREPISASDVALFLETAGVDRVVCVDLHSGQIQGFFHRAPVDNIEAASVFVSHVVGEALAQVCVVSPDAGGVSRAKAFCMLLRREGVDDCALAMVIKQRAGAGEIASMQVVGEAGVAGRDCILVDDIADTCGTLCKAAGELARAGARRVYACVTHAVLSGTAIELIDRCEALTKLFITDTIPLRIAPDALPAKIVQLSVDRMLADAILRLQSGRALSAPS